MVSTTAFTVRDAGPQDEVEIAQVDGLAAAPLRAVYRPTEAAVQQRTATAPRLARVVAVLDGRVVGTVQYSVVAESLCVSGLGVHPSYRRRGVARALTNHLEAVARNRGCKALTLYTVRETGNVEIFEHLGFHVESEEPTDLFQSDRFTMLSEVAMRKPVGDWTA